MPTVARILELAPIAQYLTSNAVAKGTLFRGGNLEPRRPVTIFMFNSILKRVFDEDPDYPGLQPIANCLYELIQPQAFKAAAIFDGNTGGQIAPPTPGGGTLPNPYDFEITAISFPLADGQSSVTLDGTGGTQDFRGRNIVVNRNDIPQSTLNLGGSFYNWNRVTGLFTANPAMLRGEHLQIIPT